MSTGITPLLRRLLLLVLLVGAGAAAFKQLRERGGAAVPAAPEWPPFEPRVVPPVAEQPDEPWLPATDDGAAPDGYPVKVKVSSGIFHVPGGRFYDRTTPDRCYPSAAAAEADGYRPAKS